MRRGRQALLRRTRQEKAARRSPRRASAVPRSNRAASGRAHSSDRELLHRLLRSFAHLLRARSQRSRCSRPLWLSASACASTARASGLGGTLLLLSVASGLFRPPSARWIRRAASFAKLDSLKLAGRPLAPRPLARGDCVRLRATSAALPLSRPSCIFCSVSLPLARRVLSLSRLARELDGPLIDPLLSHTAQGFRKDSAASPTHPNPRAPGTQSYWEVSWVTPRDFPEFTAARNVCEIPPCGMPLPQDPSQCARTSLAERKEVAT